MRKVFFIFVFFLFLFFLVGTLAPLSLVSATCSLGASPLEMSARAKPGQTVEIAWNILNLRGDRPTHVLVSKDSGADWDITYEPEAHTEQYEVSGILTDSNENFAVPKSVIVTEKPEGKIYVAHPNASLGYILVDKQIKIFVEVPENAEIGKQEEFVFTALGKCFGETGSVSASLATELKVKITPTLEYYEKPYEPEAETKTTSIGRKILDLISEPSQMSPVTMIATGTSLILIIVLIVLVIVMRGKGKGSRKKAKKKTGKRK